MAAKGKTQENDNFIRLTWEDDDGEVHELKKRLKAPRGKAARKAMPLILEFISEMSKYSDAADDNIAAQLEMMKVFSGNAEFEEVLFPYLLQIETDEEIDIYENYLTQVVIIEEVSKAASFALEKSYNRPEVKAALKKSTGGGEVAEAEA